MELLYISIYICMYTNNIYYISHIYVYTNSFCISRFKIRLCSSVSKMTSHCLDGRASILSRDKDFFGRQCTQTDSRAHPASYTMGTGGGGCFPRGKTEEGEADHSLPTSAGVKKGGAIPPLPYTFYGCDRILFFTDIYRP
jgi:hypothetical protein